MFRSYDEARTMFNRARNKSAGKPINNYLRMYMLADSNILVNYSGEGLCLILPDDRIRFIMPDSMLCKRAHSLGIHMRHFGHFGLKRKAKGLYAVQTIESNYEYFEGIEFNITNAACLNPRPPLASRVDSDKRLQWLRKLRAFKRQIRLLAKLGVLQTIIDTTDRAAITDARLGNILYGAISGKVNVEDLRIIVSYIKCISFSSSPTPDEVIAYISKLVGPYNGIALRQQFGVYREV